MGEPNICEGCKSYKPVDKNQNQTRKIRNCAINIPFISNTVKCPCLDCIVKGICVEACDRFKSYDNFVRVKKHFENKMRPIK